LAIRFNGLPLRLCCLGLAVVGVSDTINITRKAKSSIEPYEIVIVETDDTGGEVSGYLASYLLPFLTVADPGWRDLLAYGLFILIALVIYVRSNLVRVNPTLYLLGYRVLKVHYRADRQQYLITRIEPQEGQSLYVIDVAGVILNKGGRRANSR
jgi:hypothetical protein